MTDRIPMHPPIFILSHARTGSTLLRVLLDTHPDICSPGELFLGGLCEHLYRVLDTTLGQTLNDGSLEDRRARCFAETRRIVDELLGRYCESRRKQRWCEKTPVNLDYVGILGPIFPDAKYLCLHRHCLDTVCSSMELYGSSPLKLRDYIDRNGGNLTAAWIERWCDWADRLLDWEAQHPATSLRVTYEQLVADPDAALRSILTFLGVEWVPGLAERAFSVPHDLGWGDPKIASSVAIRTGHIGKGRHLDLSGISEHLIGRMHRLLDTLGYREQPEPLVARESGTSRFEVTSVQEVFNDYFPRRLARHGHWLASARTALGIVVKGDGGGRWTICVDGSGANVVIGDCAAACTVTLEATDLLDIANRRMTLTQFLRKIHVEGDVSLFDVPFRDRLSWILFGEDAAPPADDDSGPALEIDLTITKGESRSLAADGIG